MTRDRYSSSTRRYTFSATLEAQEAELARNPLIARFAESRGKLLADRYFPAYHFVSPEGAMNDPNGLSFWQGRWHLFYQAYPADGIPEPKDQGKPRQQWVPAHWGHAVSDDLIHWRDLPYALYPGVEQQCYSGSTVVEKNRVVAFYPGIGAGQMVAVSDDPLLLNWTQSGPLNTDIGDSDIWKEGDRYFGLVTTWNHKYYTDSTVAPEKRKNSYELIYGHAVWPNWTLWTSTDLSGWEPLGDFMHENTPFTGGLDEGCCPGFQPIGDKHILFFFSHINGGQYFLGDYDKTRRKFRPYEHGRFNHGQVMPGGVHAPSVASDGDGGVINILNINEGKRCQDWEQIMSLPQRLTLGEDKRVRIQPVESVESLRGAHLHMGATVIPVARDLILEGICGNCLELDIEIEPGDARWIQLNVLRSPEAEEQTSVNFYNHDEGYWWFDCQDEIVLDGTRSSLLRDTWVRPPERIKFRRHGEPLRLRVFIDHSVVEVFVNTKKYMAMRVYPGREDSLGVSLRAHGSEAMLRKLDAWQMKSIWA